MLTCWVLLDEFSVVQVKFRGEEVMFLDPFNQKLQYRSALDALLVIKTANVPCRTLEEHLMHHTYKFRVRR